ncbi:MAG: peptide deformylase [Lachnospirales bacterium]
MAERKMRYEDEPILRKKSREVTDFNEKLFNLLDDMRETMTLHNGVGLAAVQVGELKRVFVVEIGEYFKEFVNPVIVKSEGASIGSEGCLSVPGVSGYVERPESLVVKAQDREGNEFIEEADGFLAVAICHEYDHLDGILYIDKVIPEEELDFDEE